MTSAIYASVSAFLIVWLSLNVIKVRTAKRIILGDGNDEELLTAIAAQLNAIEYIPIALLLLFSLEYNDANLIIVHALGIALIIGRIVHAKGLLSGNLDARVLGMKITIWTIVGLAATNLIFIPYSLTLNL